MYVCENCGAFFREPEQQSLRENFPWIDSTRRVYRDICPECGSDEIDTAGECSCCGEGKLREDLISGVMCRDCFLEALTDHRADYVTGFAKENAESFAEYVLEKKGIPI